MWFSGGARVCLLVLCGCWFSGFTSGLCWISGFLGTVVSCGIFGVI